MTHTLFVTCTRSLSNLVPPFRRCLQWSGGFNHSISIRAASRWSQEEDDAVIRARRNGLRNSKIATILLPHRTPSAVLSRMRTLFRKEAGTFQRRNLPRQALTKGQFDEIVRAKDIVRSPFRAARPAFLIRLNATGQALMEGHSGHNVSRSNDSHDYEYESVFFAPQRSFKAR